MAASAAPITATASRRRSKHSSGNKTCVLPHARHFARRGRNRPTPRITRSRACPHGPSLPAHVGHRRTPPLSSASTVACSAHTITTGCHLRHPGEPSRQNRPSSREGSRASTNARSLPAPQTPSRPTTAQAVPNINCAATMPVLNCASQPPRAELQLRSTPRRVFCCRDRQAKLQRHLIDWDRLSSPANDGPNGHYPAVLYYAILRLLPGHQPSMPPA